MADDKSTDTSTTEDTSVSEDTSTDDVDIEAVFDEDINLDELDTGDDDDESDQEAESDSATETDEAADDTTEEDEAVSEEEEPGEDQDESEDTTEDDSKEEKPKSKQELAHEAYKAREAARQAREEAAALRQQQQDEELQRYLDDAKDDEAELAKRQNAVEAFKLQQERIGLNEQSLERDLNTAVNAIPLFKSGSEAVKNRLLKAVDTFEASNIVKDKNGRPVEVKGNLLQYLQQEANDIEQLLGDGARQQTKSKSKQKARAMTPPAKSPPKKQTDDLLDAFNEEAGF